MRKSAQFRQNKHSGKKEYTNLSDAILAVESAEGILPEEGNTFVLVGVSPKKQHHECCRSSIKKEPLPGNKRAGSVICGLSMQTNDMPPLPTNP
jgi:hypothetical protein